MTLLNRVAPVWQRLAREASDASVLAGTTLDRPHGYDRLPQPGFVGPAYSPGGLVLVGQNPANGADGLSAPDRLLYGCLEALRLTQHPVEATRALMTAMAEQIVPSWPIIRNVVTPILRATNQDLKSIAYLNLVRFRTPTNRVPTALFDSCWPGFREQIDLLRPGYLVVLGKGSFDRFLRCEALFGSLGVPRTRIARMNGDVGLPPEASDDLERIATDWLYTSAKQPRPGEAVA